MPIPPHVPHSIQQGASDIAVYWEQSAFWSSALSLRTLYTEAVRRLLPALTGDDVADVRAWLRDQAADASDAADRLAHAAMLLRGLRLDAVTTELSLAEEEYRERAEAAERMADELDDLDGLPDTDPFWAKSFPAIEEA